VLNNLFLYATYIINADTDNQEKNISSYNNPLRLHLLKDDDRFAIAIHPLARGYFQIFNEIIIFFKKLLGKIIEIKDEQKNRLLISVNSAANRLYLKPQEIQNLASLNNPIQCLRKRARIIAYAFSVAQQKCFLDNKIFTKLVQQIEVAVDDNNYTHKIRFDEIDYLVTPQGKHLLAIGSKLAEGAFGCIHSVSNITDLKVDSTMVLKLTQKPLTANSIKKELTILSRLNPRGDVIGIQLPPYELLNIADDLQVVGYIARKYDLDYRDDIFNFTSYKERLLEFRQLLMGLAFLHLNNIVHGDIKADNILVKRTNNSKFVHLADFGNAIDLLENSNLEQEKQNALKKKDIYELGLVFLEILAKNSHHHNKSCIKLEQLISLMLQKDYKVRPTASEALARLESIILEEEN